MNKRKSFVTFLLLLSLFLLSCIPEKSIQKKTIVTDTNQSYGEGSEEEYYTDLAMVERNQTLCTKILKESSRDACVSRVAIALESTSICQQVNDVFVKNDCVLAASANLLCMKKQEQEEKDLCYIGAGRVRKDLSSCNRIVNNDYKDSCIAVVARETQNIRLCAEINTKENSDWCYLVLADDTQNISLCQKIVDIDLRRRCLGMQEIS
ncbi:hypothetical protein HYX14_05140 [Candidatus Woesearchaeota archaeon]|nr:hypothetical protein [Candidatus Woesearchaeota archaeon]